MGIMIGRSDGKEVGGNAGDKEFGKALGVEDVGAKDGISGPDPTQDKCA